MMKQRKTPDKPKKFDDTNEHVKMHRDNTKIIMTQKTQQHKNDNMMLQHQQKLQ